MIKLLKKLLDKLFVNKGKNICYYINSNNVLPQPLSEEDEAKLLLEVKNGSIDARNELIEHNLRLVVFIAKKFESTKINMEDLISIGSIGLIKGIQTFKMEKNIKLATYASRCIENEILMHFRGDKKNSKNVSINDSIGFDKEGNEITLLDILKTPDPDYATNIHNQESIKQLKRYFNVLTPREKEIIIKRYGLNDSDEITQKEIAKELKISRSYVSRIEKRALTKLLREFIKHEKNT